MTEFVLFNDVHVLRGQKIERFRFISNFNKSKQKSSQDTFDQVALLSISIPIEVQYNPICLMTV